MNYIRKDGLSLSTVRLGHDDRTLELETGGLIGSTLSNGYPAKTGVAGAGLSLAGTRTFSRHTRTSAPSMYDRTIHPAGGREASPCRGNS